MEWYIDDVLGNITADLYVSEEINKGVFIVILKKILYYNRSWRYNKLCHCDSDMFNGVAQTIICVNKFMLPFQLYSPS